MNDNFPDPPALATSPRAMPKAVKVVDVAKKAKTAKKLAAACGTCPQAKMKAYQTAKALRSSLVWEADGFDQLVAAALGNWLLPGTSA